MSTADPPTSGRATAGVLASVSRLHIVAIAALGTFTFGWAFTGRYPWLLAGLCATDWFVVNLLNRAVDLPEDTANGIQGAGFVARHRRAVLAAGFGVLGGSLVVSHAIAPEITLLRLGYHALGLAYNWRLLPGGRRIKQLYFWKNTASAVGFLITVFGYPLAAAGWPGEGARVAADITPASVAWVVVFFFLFELSYEVIYDLRDMAGDAGAGVRTYPVVHGERGAVHIIDGLLATSAVALLAGWASGAVPWRLVVMVLAPALQAVLYKRALVRGITSRFCVGVTWAGAGLLVAYHLYQLAGLPGASTVPAG